LAGANFSYANLTNVNLAGGTLTSANFTGAEVRGAYFAESTTPYGAWINTITPAQLYSTASYQNHDLTGIRLLARDFSGWNFAGQNLTNVVVQNLYGGAVGGIFTAADTRGAQVELPGASSTTNLIRPDGHVAGLHLTAGQSLLVRNYHGNPLASPNPVPIPIRIDQAMAMDPTGKLRLMLNGDHWDSRISFAPGIPVALGGGTLELSFAAGIDITAQIGRTFDIFDWTGVTPAGSFKLSSSYAWDVSKLYSSGQVMLVPRIGDLNFDGQVTISDFIDLASHFNSPGTAREGDLNYDGRVTISDFIDLASNFNSNYAGQTWAITPQDQLTLSSFAASVPEPGSLGLLGVAGIAPLLGRRINERRGKQSNGGEIPRLTFCFGTTRAPIAHS